jgi:DNA replication protein DnaC
VCWPRSGRYERRPTILTSNKSLTEWAAVVHDASLATAIVDRILHHGEVFYLRGPSYRLKGRTPEGEPTTGTTTTTSTARTAMPA